MKRIGVLGGISAQATMDFEARVHRVSQRLIPQRWNQGYPPMVVWYHRRPPIRVDDDGRGRPGLRVVRAGRGGEQHGARQRGHQHEEDQYDAAAAPGEPQRRPEA